MGKLQRYKHEEEGGLEVSNSLEPLEQMQEPGAPQNKSQNGHLKSFGLMLTLSALGHEQLVSAKHILPHMLKGEVLTL